MQFIPTYFKGLNQKLWICSKETGPKHPEEPFCLTFIHSSSFSRVPPESIWQTLVKKKEFEGRKTTSRSWATHIPSAVVLSSFIIFRLCALILFQLFSLVVIAVVLIVVVFLFVCGVLQYEGGVGGDSPLSASNHPFRTLLTACQFPLPFHFLSN